MKILILANKDTGLYKFRRELLERLVSENNEIVISVPEGDYSNELSALGCRMIYTAIDRHGVNPAKDLSLMRNYTKIIKSEKPDVVLMYTIKPNIYGGLACKKTKTPYLVNVTGLGTAMENGGLLAFVTKTLYKKGLKKANCVFFQNEANRQVFVSNKIVHGNDRLIPGSGVNLERHNFEEYPTNTGNVKFLFIGRIMKDKGIDELIEAIGKVKEKYPETMLDVVGGFDGDYCETMRKAESDGLLRYHGQQKNVHSFIKDSDCTVLPSYHEGIANVLLESASTGRPLIATNVPGCRETFDEGVTGFGCEVKNAESLADAMIRFIELPYERKKQMGEAGRKKVEKEFDRNIVVNAYLEEIGKATK